MNENLAFQKNGSFFFCLYREQQDIKKKERAGEINALPELMVACGFLSIYFRIDERFSALFQFGIGPYH